MPINFAVKIVRLNVYMTIASPMTLTFSQGYKCVSIVTTVCLFLFCVFKLQCLGQYLSYYTHTCHVGRRLNALYAHARFDDLDLVARS